MIKTKHLFINKEYHVVRFGDQEPEDNEAIYNFAKTNYDIEFPMFAKIDVLGENASPAFKNLITQSSIHPDWNFYKYIFFKIYFSMTHLKLHFLIYPSLFIFTYRYLVGPDGTGIYYKQI